MRISKPIKEEIRRFIADTYGIELTSSKKLKSANDRLTLRVNSTKGTYVFKVSDPGRKAEDVRATLRVYGAARDNHIQVPLMVSTINSRRYTRYKGRFAYLYKYIEGEQPKPSRENIQKIGDLLGKLHSLPVAKSSLPKRPVPGEVLSPGKIRTVKKKASAHPETKAFVLKELKSVPSFNRLPRTVVHGDMSYGNLIRKEHEIYMIDFDDTGVAAGLPELAHCCIYMCTFTPENRREWGMDSNVNGVFWDNSWVQTMVDAYQNIRELSQDEKYQFIAACKYALLRWFWYGDFQDNLERYRMASEKLKEIDLH